MEETECHFNSSSSFFTCLYRKIFWGAECCKIGRKNTTTQKGKKNCFFLVHLPVIGTKLTCYAKSKKRGQVLATSLEEFKCEMLVRELWSHRMVGVGKDLWTSFSPIPDSNAGSSGAGCTGLCPSQ